MIYRLKVFYRSVQGYKIIDLVGRRKYDKWIKRHSKSALTYDLLLIKR